MKRHLLLLSFLSFAYSVKVNAQDNAFKKGKIIFTLGYGAPNLGKSVLKAYESKAGYKATGLGPAHAKIDYGLSDKISFGVSINYVSFGADWADNSIDSVGDPVVYVYSTKFQSISILGRMNIHFATTGNLDPYWGIAAGYKNSSFSWDSNDPFFTGGFKFPSGFGFETTFGLRYYFTPNIGIYTEIGIAKSIIQGGLAIKL